MAKQIQSPPGQKFQVVPQTEQYPPQVFCDGIAGMVMTAAVCKLDLFQVVGTDDHGERRKLTQTLVIPTAALMQLSRAVIDNMEKNAPALKAAFAGQESEILGLKKAKQPT